MSIRFTAGLVPARLPVRSDLPAPEKTGWSKRAIEIRRDTLKEFGHDLN